MKPLSDRTFRWIALLSVAASLIYLSSLSWLKWTEILIDSGRELYIPKVLAEGRLLYRDIFYIYGPFSPYFNALLYKLFGVHAYVLAAGGYAALLAILGFIQALACIFLNRWLALFVTLLFLFLFPFGHHTAYPIFNYVIPYSYPAVHSLLFSLAALFFFHRQKEAGKPNAGLLTAIFLFLAALTKVEVGLWLALALLLGYSLDAKHRKGASGAEAALVAGKRLAPPLIAAMAVYIGFYLQGTGADLSSKLSDNALSNIFMAKGSYAWTNFSGGNLHVGISLLLLETFEIGLIAVALTVAGRYFDHTTETGAEKSRLLQTAVAGAALALVVILFLLPPLRDPYFHFLPVPVFCLVAALGIGNRWLEPQRADRILLCCLGLFGLLMLLRMLANANVASMGFYLLVPGFLVYQIIVFRILPDLSGSRTAALLFRCVFTAIGIFVAAWNLEDTKESYASINAVLPASRGSFYFQDANRVEAYKELLDDLSRPGFHGKTLVVFPEGLWINLLTDLDNPLYFYQFLPVDLPSPQSIEVLIEQFERHKPDLFLLTDRRMQEYGVNSAREYVGAFEPYIEDNYEFVSKYGPGILLLARKKTP